MRRIRLRLTINISNEDLDLIERHAADILDVVGLEIQWPDVVKQLAAEPYVTLRAGRVCFDRDHTLAVLAAQHQPLPPLVESGIHVSTGSGALNILDERTETLRPATTSDLLRILRICDNLGLGGDPPLTPSDIPMPLREVALYKLAWESTRDFSGRDIGSIEVGEYVYQMAQVANKRFSIPLYVISPLRINTENLALVLHFADRLSIIHVGGMPMPGATSPLLAPAYLAQSLAESVGGLMVLSTLLPQARVRLGSKNVAFDPYTNTIACGSPESLLQGQMEVALWARFGVRSSQFFWSMAGGADAQAAAERMAGVLMGALAGVRSFGVAGRLQGEAFSLAQMIIDMEIAAYVDRLLRGQAWEIPADWLAEISEAVRAGTFLSAPSTAAHYRREVMHSNVFDRLTLSQRQQTGTDNLAQRVAQRIDAADTPGKIYLTPEARREMARIYEHAAEHWAS